MFSFDLLGFGWEKRHVWFAFCAWCASEDSDKSRALFAFDWSKDMGGTTLWLFGSKALYPMLTRAPWRW